MSGIDPTSTEAALNQLSREQLELQAYRAIAGGEYVRSRILHGLSLGDPSVESTAYLIKSRVKRPDSLLLKVLDRKHKDPDYDAFTVRDIVGFRLLTLFRNELPILVRRFLEFIVLSHSGATGLFGGSSLRSTITEIKIYGLNSYVDPNMDLCVREFIDYGFSLSSGDDQTEGDVPHILIDRKESEYSSIHVVLQARGPSGYETDTVPVEVQLRTSLEDVWGEIDHRAVYKAKQIQKMSPEVQAGARELDGLRRRIVNLKKILDACSSAADDIELDLAHDEAGDIVSSYKAYTSAGLTKLNDIALPNSASQLSVEAVAVLSEFYDLVREHRSGEAIRAMDDWFSLLARGTDLLERMVTSLEADNHMQESLFRTKMELGLSYYWQAVLLKQSVRPAKRYRGLADGWHQAIRKSTSIYVSLVASGVYPERAALLFRLGNALAFQGSYATALLQYKSAYDILPRDTSIPADDYLRLRIPRQYGFALWLEGSRLEQQALDLGSRGLYHTRERQFYLDAIKVTLPVFNFSFTSGEFDMSARSPEEESRITANNVLDYAVCFADAGGCSEDLIHANLDTDGMKALLDCLAEGRLDTIAPITLADTARKAYLFLECTKEAVRCARRVLDLSTTLDLAVPLSDFHYKKMIREAEDTVRDHEKLPAF